MILSLEFTRPVQIESTRRDLLLLLLPVPDSSCSLHLSNSGFYEEKSGSIQYRDLPDLLSLKAPLRVLHELHASGQLDYCTSITLPAIWISNKSIINLFNGHLHWPQSRSPESPYLRRLSRPNLYSLSCQVSRIEEVKLCILMLFFIEVSERESWKRRHACSSHQYPSQVVEMCLGFMVDLDVPFYVRFKFAELCLNDDKERFEKYRSMLEQTRSNSVFRLEFGGTALQRQLAIKEIFDRLIPAGDIVDLGCGTGDYISLFSAETADPSSFNYHAIDVSSYALSCARNLSHSLGLSKIQFYSSFTDFCTQSDAHLFQSKCRILCSEVIEHMPLDQAQRLIAQVLDWGCFSFFLITTPDKSFNTHYNLKDSQMRHSDHDWEMNHEDFRTWIQTICSEKEYNVFLEFGGIGHSVDGVFATQYVLFQRP